MSDNEPVAAQRRRIEVRWEVYSLRTILVPFNYPDFDVGGSAQTLNVIC